MLLSAPLINKLLVYRQLPFCRFLRLTNINVMIYQENKKEILLIKKELNF